MRNKIATSLNRLKVQVSLCYISECYCCYELKGCEESIKSDLVLQDLAPVEKAVIPKLSHTKYGIDGASWFFNNA